MDWVNLSALLGFVLLISSATAATTYIEHSSGLINETAITSRGVPLVCGSFNTASTKDIIGINNWLRYEAKDCGAPPKTCRRQGCYNTSAVYICNDMKQALKTACEQIAAKSEVITNRCCGGNGLSGQYFDARGWNIIVGYGNCNHNRDSKGVERGKFFNGECKKDLNWMGA